MYQKYAKKRDQLGLTDYQVCKKCKFYCSVISDWKRGKSTPKIDKLMKIADAIGEDVTFFLEKKG